MSKLKLLGSVLILAGAGATLLSSADFWQTKKFSEWSGKEVNKILSDSPWAHPIEVVVSGGGGGMPGGGGGGRGGRGGGGGMGNASDATGERAVLTLRFLRALPVKQAVLRQKFGDQVLSSPDAQADLARPENAYILAITDVPSDVFGTRVDPAKLGEMYKKSAQINVKGREPIKAVEARVAPVTPYRGTLLLAFPKDKPITLEDNEIEVEVRLGRIEVKHKMKLKDMVFDGKLEI